MLRSSSTELYLDESTWEVLQQYVQQIERSLKQRRLLPHATHVSTNLIVSAIVQKFLMENAKRINALAELRNIRGAVRAIEDNGLRAKASNTARSLRRNFATSTSGGTGGAATKCSAI